MPNLTELEALQICRECAKTAGSYDLPRRTSKRILEMLKEGKCPFFTNAPLLNADDCAKWLKDKIK